MARGAAAGYLIQRRESDTGKRTHLHDRSISGWRSHTLSHPATANGVAPASEKHRHTEQYTSCAAAGWAETRSNAAHSAFSLRRRASQRNAFRPGCTCQASPHGSSCVPLGSRFPQDSCHNPHELSPISQLHSTWCRVQHLHRLRRTSTVRLYQTITRCRFPHPPPHIASSQHATLAYSAALPAPP